MPSILVDDTKNPSKASYETFVTDLEAIGRFRITRNSSYKWAQNLRYLVCDEDDDDNLEVLEPETRGKGKERAYEITNILNYQASDDQQSTEEDEHTIAQISRSGIARTEDEIPGPSSWRYVDRKGSLTSLSAEQKAYSGNRPDLLISVDSTASDQAQNVDVYDSDEEKAMLDYAIAMSLAEDEDDQDIIGLSEVEQDQLKSEQEEQERHSKEDDDNRSCNLCSSCPHFPRHKKCTIFRVVQFGSPDEHRERPCEHYVAVSYCWPKDQKGDPVPTKSTYAVKETGKDGIEIERPCRAPDEVIDRAVDLARSQGIRLIWIDQECLPQDNSEEQAIGIQAMDMVYQQAIMSVGLIDNVVATQSQLDAIASVLLWHATGKQRFVWPTPDVTFDMVCEMLMSFVRAFKKDLFHTRAWILQEMFSAGRRAMLLIKLENGACWRASQKTLEIPQFHIPGIFNISVEDVQLLITAARDFLLETFRLSRQGGITAWTNSSNAFIGESLHLLEEMELFHPRHVQATHFSSFVHVRGGTAYGPRKVCNAATALTFLSTRFNSLPRDRLAIMANLCDYEVRLDVREIDTRFKSLTTCLFALAILNGDLSLLIPDVYRAKLVQVGIHELISSIKTTSLKPGLSISLRNANRYQLQNSNLALPGYLWTVDRFIDLTPIQMQFKERWDRWKCYKLSFGHRQGESHEDFQRRILKVKEAIHATGTVSEDLKKELNIQELPWEEFEHSNRHSNDLQSSPSNDPVSVAVTRFISAERIDNDPSVRFMIGYIIFQILLMLHTFLGEPEVANSVWHSVRTDAVSVPTAKQPLETKSDTDLPDDVAGLFKDNWGNLSQRMWDVLKLDRSETGTFFQIWLIERIMQHGGFWVGRYNRPLVPWSRSAEDEAKVEAEIKAKAEKSERHGKSKIMQDQLTKQILASMMLAQKGEIESISDAFDGVNFGAMVSFAYVSASNVWGIRAEEERAKRISVFDVDGPCDVFTPYDADMERLPRPEYRSMKACWVVEKISEGSKGGEGEQTNADSPGLKEATADSRHLVSRTEVEQPLGQAEGHSFAEVEPEQLLPQIEDMKSNPSVERDPVIDSIPSNLLSHSHAESELETQTAGEVSESTTKPPILNSDQAQLREEKKIDSEVDKEAESNSATPQTVDKFRVIGRVRGAWECMDEPMGVYTFV